MTDAILVTGAAGFIGSNYIDYLRERTSFVPVVLDRFDDFSVVPRKCFAAMGVEVIRHDLTYPIKYSPAMAELAPHLKYIVHMAAGSHVDRSIADPASFTADNVLGTVHLLEWVRANAPQAKVLYFSTDEVFGPAANDQVFGEFDRHEPNNPYAASKSGGEMACPAYANTYGLQIAISHCSNVFGPRQHAEKFVPLAIQKILSGEKLLIHARDGVPSSRIYIHVTDVCRAIQTILEHGDTIVTGTRSGRYNISGKAEVSNVEVALTLARFLERPLHYELVEDVPNRPRHDQRYAISWDRLRDLGWEPRIGLENGLAQLCHAALGAAA